MITIFVDSLNKQRANVRSWWSTIYMFMMITTISEMMCDVFEPYVFCIKIYWKEKWNEFVCFSVVSNHSNVDWNDMSQEDFWCLPHKEQKEMFWNSLDIVIPRLEQLCTFEVYGHSYTWRLASWIWILDNIFNKRLRL